MIVGFLLMYRKFLATCCVEPAAAEDRFELGDRLADDVAECDSGDKEVCSPPTTTDPWRRVLGPFLGDAPSSSVSSTSSNFSSSASRAL